METSQRPPSGSLQWHRRRLGLTQEEVAARLAQIAWEQRHERVAVDASMVSKWERGKKRPWPLYRQLLCVLFQADDHELGLTPSPYPVPANFHLDGPDDGEPMNLSARLARARHHDRSSPDGGRSLDRRSFLGIGGAALASTILAFAADQARRRPLHFRSPPSKMAGPPPATAGGTNPDRTRGRR